VSRSTRLLIVALCALLSCSSGGEPAPEASPPAVGGGLPALATPGDRAPIPADELLEPLTALGPCTQEPKETVDAEVEGLVLPESAVLTSVAEADPLTNVQGYIPQTPVQIRVFYQQHPSLTVLSVEDEIRESEVLTEAGEYRTFVKAQAICELGSIFVAIVSPAPAPTP
jgi:hypothetical protein